MTTEASTTPVHAEMVRYIKLGRKGEWENECLYVDGALARFGTWSSDPERYALASAGEFESLRQTFVRDGKSGPTATRFANDTLAFFAKDDTIWITFADRKLWWARFTPEAPFVHSDGHGTARRVVGRWSSDAIGGNPLWMERLAGFLTKSAGYQGTTFELSDRVRDYVIRRINGLVQPDVANAEEALLEMKRSLVPLMRSLEPKDFELLVDLVFTAGGGWRRVSERGKTMKTVDMVVEMPSTQERGWIQVKSEASPAVLAEVLASGEALKYDRAFFVYHSGSGGENPEPRMTVIGPDELATRIIETGLVRWLIDKVS